MCRHLLFYGLLFLAPLCPALGQIQIHGVVTDIETGAPVEYAQIVLYRYKTNEVVAFKLTDDKGRYELTFNDRNTLAFTLKTNSLSHENIEKDIFIDAQKNKRYEVNIALKGKAYMLTEAQVTAKLPPLIVKQDTVIYNPEYWTDEFDQSLEEVLAKIPGFEVLPNGDLRVNGKVVNKVLIDGQEVSGGSAALITRNLSPGRVKSVEVRFDEKDDKIKSSLLSQDKFVVLDIKLKDDFNQAFFGRMTATLGHQDQLRPGGTGRFFSLQSKVRFQLLGEWDDFGDKSISLSDIRNLGAEALAKIFDVPADFSRLRENPEYSNEIYGFREYVSNRTASVGLTGKIDIAPNVELFLGSFNYLDRVGSQRIFNQEFISDNPLRFFFNEAQNFSSANSKNKAELVINPKNMKLRYNFNAVFSKDESAYLQDESQLLRYDFQNAGNTKDFYHNLLVERRFSDQSGLHFNTLYSTSNRDMYRTFSHNNPLYASLFDSLPLNGMQMLRQTIPLNQRRLLANAFYQVSWKSQFTQLGFRYLQDDLSGEKEFSLGEEPQNGIEINPWQGEQNNLRYRQILPYIEHKINTGPISINARAGISHNTFPATGRSIQETKNVLEYSARLSYSFNQDDELSFSYSQSTSAFPLYQMLPGQEFINFQTIAIPDFHRLTPQRERVMSFSATTFALGDQGMVLELAGISGKAFNNASFDFNEYGFIQQYFDQLPSQYLLLVGKIGKIFERFPLQMKLEPSYIFNKTYNRASNEELTAVSTQISAIDYRAFTTLKEKSYDFETRIKFTRFAFRSELDEGVRNQEMWNILLKYKQALMGRKLLLTTDWRYTSFSGIGSADLFIHNFSLRYLHKKTAITFEVHNTFNATQFVIQDITPAFYIDSRQFIFGRYAKAGISIDIN